MPINNGIGPDKRKGGRSHNSEIYGQVNHDQHTNTDGCGGEKGAERESSRCEGAPICLTNGAA